MKHAYLILSHNEFGVLDRLIRILDCEENDIFIHFDKKVRHLPIIHTKKSKCVILKHRVSGCWGDVSLVDIELELMKAAYVKGAYDFYHIVSGVHYPLMTMSELHHLYEAERKCFFQPMISSEEEVEVKMRRCHFFSRLMMSFRFNSLGYKVGRFLWNLSLRLQNIVNYKRNANTKFYKSSQWCSLTESAVEYLIAIEDQIRVRYSYTFCPDEYFVLSELMNSPLKEQIGYKDNLLKQEWVSTHPKVYKMEDYDSLMASGCFYARKFTSDSIELLDKIYDAIK